MNYYKQGDYMRKSTILIHLPDFTDEHAHMTAFALEQIANAIWQEYGDNMADFQGRVFPEGPPDLGEPQEPPDDDYPHPTFDEIPI
jgi:hypothetical protein